MKDSKSTVLIYYDDVYSADFASLFKILHGMEIIFF